jgi:hypothetical protein
MVYDKSINSEFDIVHTYAPFVDCIKINGLSNYKSSDNDLGLRVYEKAAPVGLAVEQIRGLLNNYIKHLKTY